MKTKLERDGECETCIRKAACLIPVNICPCKTCIVRPTCKTFCYERHLTCATYFNILPLPEDSFSGIGYPYV